MPSRRAPQQDSPIYTILGWLLLLGIVKTVLEAVIK
jgi:hypothetical protein